MLAVVCMSLALCAIVQAQDTTSTAAEDVNAKSLPLRTALHHDPTLASPLERLLALYREAGRASELIGIYRAHTLQYPQDVSAAIVFVRLLVSTGDPEAVGAARRAVGQFPKNAYLHYVLYEILRDKQQDQALQELDRAIQLETRATRKVTWIDQLLPAAIEADDRELAEKHLKALAGLVQTPQQQLEVAQRMVKYGFFEPALELLDRDSDTPPAPELMVSIQLEAATAEVGVKNSAAAAARLDKLLAKVTADYWRRDEIVRRRLALVRSQPERDSMIASARQRVAQRPRDEAAAIDLAQMLAVFELRRDALQVLLEAGQRMPDSSEIEQRTLELLDRLRDYRGREQYVAGRLEQQPDRSDLLVLHVKTLYLLGRSDEGLTELKEAVEGLSDVDRARNLLEMARFLRRSLLPEEATELFREVVELQPARLDVRREVAELYLSVGDRARMRKLLGQTPVQEAELENLLDLLQFMIQNDLLVETRTLLSRRMEQEKANLDLSMLLLNVYRRLGAFAPGEALLAESRAWADTGARYRLWLESAMAFHEEFDTYDAFLDAELGRLAADPAEWTLRRLERRIAFAQIAARSGHKQQAAEMLQQDVQGELEQDFRIRIRSELVALIRDDPQQMLTVQNELTALADEDRQHADLHYARLALLHKQAKRMDLMAAVLDKIDVTRIQDPDVLRSLLPLYAERPEGGGRIPLILERLTVLDPTNRVNWQQWLTQLAVAGSEARLRGAIRRLLAGVEDLELTDETRQLLESHLGDSYWRDIGRCLSDGQEAALADALQHLAAVARMSQSGQHWLWIEWIRAYLLNRQGHERAFAEALQELQRVATEITAVPEEADEAAPEPASRIAFPGGLSVSLDHARRLLAAAAPPVRPSQPPQRQGPLPEFQVRWTYQTGVGTVITAIVPMDTGRTLICDQAGDAHCVDTQTGKLLWRERLLPSAMPIASSSHRSSSSIAQRWQQIQSAQQTIATMPAAQQAQMAAQIQREIQRLLSEVGVSTVPLSDGRGRIYVPGAAAVSCYSSDNGKLLWEANVGAVTPQKTASSVKAQAAASLRLFDEQLVTYSPACGTVTKIDPTTGKIVWCMERPSKNSALVTAHNSGVSLCGRRLLVYGVDTAILDVETGEVEWSFEPWRVREFPVKLKDPGIATSVSTPALSQPQGYASAYTMPTPAVHPSAYVPGSTSRYVNYLQADSQHVASSSRVRLTAPAVVWAANVQSGATRCARLLEGRLLLFDQSGLDIVRTDLPFAGKRVNVAGQLIGIVGRKACLLVGNQIQLVDVTSGETQQCDLQEITQGRVMTPIQVVLDGAWAYALGPGGILCVNTNTARRSFRVDWPDELLPATATPAAGSAAPVPSYGQTPNVSTVYYGSPPTPSVSIYHGVPGMRAPSLSCVDRGVLYATVAPNEAAALIQRDADGQ